MITKGEAKQVHHCLLVATVSQYYCAFCQQTPNLYENTKLFGKTTFNISEKTSKGWNSRARAEDHRTIVESFYKIKVSINSRNVAYFCNEHKLIRINAL